MKKVYIIDDDKDFLEIIDHILRKFYITLTTPNMDLDQLGSFQPDLIMMDNSVGTDHSEIMLKRIKGKFPLFNTPIILVSAHHDISKLAELKGISGYIRKPSSIAYIRSYVDSFFIESVNHEKIA
ncbi:MAG: response regulator [Chitinophagaceae bacterium]|nr:MAG: response regulator [Chitinophagaceae bacterium]